MTRLSLFLGIATAMTATLGLPLTGHAAEVAKATVATPSAALQDALQSKSRTPANVARDPYRHPGQTLTFFKLAPAQTVIEITPGGGWYSEILAPYLRDHGRYIAAVVDPSALAEGKGRDYQQKARATLEQKFSADPTQYGKATFAAFDPAAPVFGPKDSADLVLTFRNVHNWRMAGQAEGMFKGFFSVLKPGGVLGVVEHRAKADVPADDKSGYVGEAQVIAMAKAAGFVLQESSPVNHNPLDTKDYPNGVWTLPPANNHDAADDAKYKAIGESDRMTLRFVKPAK